MELEITAWPPLTHILFYCLIVLSVEVGVMAYLMHKLGARLTILEGAKPPQRRAVRSAQAEQDRADRRNDFGYSIGLQKSADPTPAALEPLPIVSRSRRSASDGSPFTTAVQVADRPHQQPSV